MGVIMIKCPTTARLVSTGIEADAASFEALRGVRSTVSCPACGRMHMWSAVYATLVEGRDHRPVSGPSTEAAKPPP